MRELRGSPTLLVASVNELRVVLLPEEGLPTRPIRGSRGMLTDCVVSCQAREQQQLSTDGCLRDCMPGEQCDRGVSERLEIFDDVVNPCSGRSQASRWDVWSE